MRYGMAVDTRKCVGCSDCVVACQTENNVPIGYCREWVVEVMDGTYPQLEIEIRSERCNHCDNAPCVRCCPTGASHVAEGGIVLVKPGKCIGCGACIASCPYDARYPHPDGYVDKCTFCIQRVRNGRYPACVEACPTGSRKFGNLLDPDSEIRYLIEHKRVFRLKEDLNTEPKFYYFFAE